MRVEARVEHGSSDSVELDARIRPGPPLRVELARLAAAAFGERVETRQGARVTVDGGAVDVRGLRLGALGGSIAVDGRFDQKGTSDLTLKLAALELSRAAPFVPPDLAPGGHLDVDLTFAGRMSSPRVELALAGRDLALRGAPIGTLELKAALRGSRASLELGLVEGPRSIRVEARAPARVNLAAGVVRPIPTGRHALRLGVHAIDDVWARRLAPLPEDLRFRVDATLAGAGRRGAWKVDGKVGATVEAKGVAPSRVNLTLGAEPNRQVVHVEAAPRPDGATAPLALTLDAEVGGDLERLATGAPLDPQTGFEAHVVVPRLPLAPFSALLPPALYDLRGTLEVDAHTSGTVAAPALSGKVDLAGVEVTVVPLGQRITALSAELALEQRRLAVRQASFRAADGRGRIEGFAELGEGGPPTAALSIRIDQLPLVSPGAPPAVLDTRVGVKVSQAPDGGPEVKVAIRGTTLRVIELASGGPRAIPAHPRVRYVEVAPPPPTPASPTPSGPPLRLQVDLPEPLLVLGPGLDMKWAGRLHISAGAKTAVDGALKARSGYVELLGNRFVIDEGEITLADDDGQVVPFLRIVARAQTEEALVTATIRGKATRPELVFESDPPLPTDLILTLLVTGRTTPNEEDERSVQQQAAALFASFQSPAIESALRERLGVDRVRLTFGQGGVESPVLSFGKHLTRWLYVEARYRHNPVEGEENETELSSEIQLGPRWTLETTYGDQGVGGGDVFWRVPLD